jgi:hypothetical protein
MRTDFYVCNETQLNFPNNPVMLRIPIAFLTEGVGGQSLLYYQHTKQ